MRSVLSIRLVLVRWQLWALIAAGACLTSVIHHAYATVYTEPDLQVWWMAARLWLAGVDPYGPTGDRLLGTGSGFAYPFPAVLICLPLAPLSLAWASTVWALMSPAIAGVLPIALHNRLNPRIVAPMLAYFPLWASLEEGQWGPMLLLWTILSLYWLRKERWLLSGAAAALTLLKPNVGIALLAGIAAYALCINVPRRWWMGLAFGLLIFWMGTQALAPGWPLAWLEQLRAYDAEDQNRIDAVSVVGALAGALTLTCAFFAWRRRDALLLLAGVVTVAMLILPTRSFYNHVALLLPIALLPPHIATLVALLGWSVLVLPPISTDIVLARSLAFYLPLSIGLTGAMWQTRAQEKNVAAR
ncbi:MAG: hypothetical protein NZ699_07190 [Roseiflexus sp.]|nr:hypothetical protein [Roseiflexus sp.]